MGTVDGRIPHQAHPWLAWLGGKSLKSLKLRAATATSDFVRPRPNEESRKCHEQRRDALAAPRGASVSSQLPVKIHGRA